MARRSLPTLGGLVLAAIAVTAAPRPAVSAPNQATATVQVTLTIEPFALLTWFEATASVGNGKSEGQSAQSAETQPVLKFRVFLPSCITADNLDLSRIELDGQAVSPQSASIVVAGEYLQLIFHRSSALPLPPITEPFPMQLTIGLQGGHSLVASGLVVPTNYHGDDDDVAEDEAPCDPPVAKPPKHDNK